MMIKRLYTRFIRPLLDFRPNRRFIKPMLYSSLFSVLFLFFIVLLMPLERFIPNAEAALGNTLERRVTIGGISTTLLGDLVITDMTIGLKQGKKAAIAPEKNEGGKTEKKKRLLTYDIEELRVDVGALALLLFNTLDVEADMSALGGEVHVAYKGPSPRSSDKEEEAAAPQKTPRRRAKAKRGKKGAAAAAAVEEVEETPESEEGDDDVIPVSLQVEMQEINLMQLRDLREEFPVPLKGILNLNVDLASETSSLSMANGSMTFTLSGVQLSKKGYQAELMGSSLVVPALVIESIEAEIEFAAGYGTVKKFEVKSKHCAVTLEGGIKLADKFDQSKIDLYLTFKILPAYLKKSAAIKTLMGSADTFSPKMRRAHRTDGAYGFRYHGRIGASRFTPAKVSKFSEASANKAKKKKKRRRTRRKPRKRQLPSKLTSTPPGTAPAAVAPPPPAAPPPPSDLRAVGIDRSAPMAGPPEESLPEEPPEAVPPPRPRVGPPIEAPEEEVEEEAPPEEEAAEEEPAEEEEAEEEEDEEGEEAEEGEEDEEEEEAEEGEEDEEEEGEAEEEAAEEAEEAEEAE